MSHTPGPWEIHPEYGMVIREDSIICYFDVSALPESERKANARLIAAAPNLLSACRAQHQAIDILLAMLIESKDGFLPSKSVVWPMLVQGIEAIASADGVRR